MTTAALPATARAAVLKAFNEPLVIEEVPVPPELEPGAVLVKVEACSVCGTDVHQARGTMFFNVELPAVLGHEMTGSIVALGPGADRDSIGQPLRVGDRLVWEHASCGRCFFCSVERRPALCQNRRLYSYSCVARHPYVMGGYAEYCYVLPRAGRIRVPDDVSDEVASLSSCAFRTVMNAFEQAGPIESRDSVVIQGSGPLGILAAGVAKVAGARQVIVIGAPAHRLELAGAFGADRLLSLQEHPSAEARVAQVLEWTEGRGADLVFEFSGNPLAVDEGMRMARTAGRYVVVGQSRSEKVPLDPGLITKKNLRIQGNVSADIGHYWRALAFASKYGRSLPFARMVTGRYGLQDINHALDRMAALQEIKPMVYPWETSDTSRRLPA